MDVVTANILAGIKIGAAKNVQELSGFVGMYIRFCKIVCDFRFRPIPLSSTFVSEVVCLCLSQWHCTLIALVPLP